MREGLDKQFVRPLAQYLGGEPAEERAGLIAANLLGLAFMRGGLGSGPLSADEIEPLVALIAPVLQSYVDEEPY